jgi:thiamine kinase-like enzyme
MILSGNTVTNFLCQYNLLDWQLIHSAKVVKHNGRNNTFSVLIEDKTIFVKQSLEETSYQTEGLIHEVAFYNWFKKQGYQSKYILPCLGYEPTNKVLVLSHITGDSTINSQNLTNNQIQTICEAIFSFHHIHSLPSIPLMLMDKPNIWKFLNENSESISTKEWLDVVIQIERSAILKEVVDKHANYWNPTHICNADIKLENFILDVTKQQIYWIDWERFCIADGLWDIAGVLRMVFFKYLNQYKNFDVILNDDGFQQNISTIWHSIFKYIPDVSKEKLLLSWIVSILDKTLESIQANTVNYNNALSILNMCENMFLNSIKIYSLFS